MTFSQKRINIQFSMANGGSHNAVGLRVMAHIENNGGPTQGQASLAIFGLPLAVMNELSTVGTSYAKMYKNTVTVEAGDDGGMSLVWAGVIATAYVDAQSMPDVAFRVESTPGAFDAVKPVPPVSIKGTADAAGMMKDIAKQLGLGFENAGVNVKLANPYYAGTAWTQMLQIARAGGFDVTVEKNVMAIVPADKAREGDAVLISPQTGLIGYPAFNQRNVIVAALFDPKVKYLGNIEVKSELTPACGKWKVNNLQYDLEAQVPQGRWTMIIEGVQIGPTVA